MFQFCLFLSVIFLGVSASVDFDDAQGKQTRVARQLGLGSLLRPLSNQGISCETPLRQKGRCVPMEQCVLKELDEDYVKNKGYLCALGQNGPVGVCCSNTIKSPVVYREGMFGNKNTAGGQRAGDSEETDVLETPENDELVDV